MDAAHSWTVPPDRPLLAKAQVHVWCFNMVVDADLRQALYRSLSTEERHKAARLRREEVGQRYIVAHGILRHILAKYLLCTPNEITFRHGTHGKPYLLHGNNPSSLCFNLSHSHDHALLAIIQNGEIGVDIEFIRPIDALDLARRYFTPKEAAWLISLPNHQHLENFYYLWTRKEAIIKAIGGSVMLDLRHVEIEQPSCGAIQYAEDEISKWTLHNLPPIDGYAAALARQGDTMSQQFWILRGTEL